MNIVEIEFLTTSEGQVRLDGFLPKDDSAGKRVATAIRSEDCRRCYRFKFKSRPVSPEVVPCGGVDYVDAKGFFHQTGGDLVESPEDHVCEVCKRESPREFPANWVIKTTL